MSQAYLFTGKSGRMICLVFVPRRSLSNCSAKSQSIISLPEKTGYGRKSMKMFRGINLHFRSEKFSNAADSDVSREPGIHYSKHLD